MTIRLGRKFFALTLLLLIATAVTGQTYKPGIELQSLMNMRYYENNGGFLVEDLQLVFPAANVGDARIVVTDQSGSVVDSVPLRYERMEFPAFGRFRAASGHPGNLRVGRSGNFVMSVIVGGQTITSMPFSLREENSSDPFNPVKRFVRDGSWRDLGYLSVVPDDPNGEVRFSWWMSTSELPGGMKQGPVTLHLLVNGKEFAASRGPVVASTNDWYFFAHKQLSVPTMPRNHWLTLSDLTKQNGEIALVLKANGQAFKTYKTTVSGGQIQRLPHNALNFEPHAQWISPRFVDVSSGSNSSYKMFEMFWLKKQ